MTDIDISHIRRLDGGLLLVFRELLRQRRTTEAARRLGLTQSTVSHALDRLRDLFGDPLFVRRPHGLEPTRRALELGPRIDALIDLADATMRHEGGFEPARSERRFAIAAPEHVAALVGARLLDRLGEAAPRASVAVQFLLGDAALNALRRGEIDLALGRFGALPAGLSGETLYDDEYCLVARNGHPRIDGRVDAETFASVGHISIEDPLDGVAYQAAPNPGVIRTVAVAPKWLTALVMVAATDAIATPPLRFAERVAPTMGLQVIRLDPGYDSFPITMVRRTGRPDAGLDWFADQIRAAASA
jgi:DNA-binding transcriptional LysR family regulator